MLISVLRPWDSQPQEPVDLDLDNPLLKGLVDVIEMVGVPRSVILKTPPTYWGTTPTLGACTLHGKALDNSAAFGSVYFSRSDGAYTATEVTHLCFAAYDAVAGGGFDGIFTTSDSAGASTNIQLYFGGPTQIFGPGIGTNTPTILGTGVGMMGYSCGASSAALYWKGLKVASSSGATLSTLSTSRLILNGERNASTGNATKGKVVLHLFFNRVLSEEEHRALAANPWQIYKPRRVWVWVSVGGALLNIVLSAVVSVSASRGTVVRITRSANATIGAAIVKSVASAKSAAVTMVASLSKAASSTKTAALTIGAAIVKQVSKPLAAAVTTQAAIATIKAKLLTLSATVATSASLARSVSVIRSAASTTTATVTRRIAAVRAATLAASATVLKTVQARLTASVAATASVTKSARKSLAAAVTTAATISATRVRLLVLSATVATSASLAKAVRLTRSASATTAASVTKRVAIVRAATVSLLARIALFFGSGNQRIGRVTVTSSAVWTIELSTEAVWQIELRADPLDNLGA